MKLLLNAKEFIFISKADQYYLEGNQVECESDCTDWKEDRLIKDGWGFFNGLTMVSYKGYVGELQEWMVIVLLLMNLISIMEKH